MVVFPSNRLCHKLSYAPPHLVHLFDLFSFLLQHGSTNYLSTCRLQGFGRSCLPNNKLTGSRRPQQQEPQLRLFFRLCSIQQTTSSGDCEGTTFPVSISDSANPPPPSNRSITIPELVKTPTRRQPPYLVSSFKYYRYSVYSNKQCMYPSIIPLLRQLAAVCR